jgi:signal peptidase I
MNPLVALRNWPPGGDQAQTLRERYFLFLPRQDRLRRNGAATTMARAGLHSETTTSRSTNTVPPLLASKTDGTQTNERQRPAPMKTGKKPPQTVPASSVKPPPKQPDNTRETIESIVVAFVLAFLFRTFEAEAFVIPTGSMAPTLYGQQRDVHCSECGTRFAVGASSGDAPDAEVRDSAISRGFRSQLAVCPNANCRYPNDILAKEIFAGDRILVNKFPYEFGHPQRWDVVVFKFPEHAKINYIKRMAGLPGERLIIENGDVKVCPLSDGPAGIYHIPRKSPEKQRHLQLLVHDNDHPARKLLAAGWPESWDNADTSTWNADPQARTFEIAPDASDREALHWLRYTHYLPSGPDWTLVEKGQSVAGTARPQLITDFYGYNGRMTFGEASDAVSHGVLPEFRPQEPEQWVGDLTINCSIEVLAADGELRFELIEGLRRYQCQIDLKTGLGKFAFLHEQERGEGEPSPAGEAFETGMNRAGAYAVSFANVDDRLCFWVNDRLVKSLNFEPDDDYRYKPQMPPVDPTEQDKSPVGIGARGAAVRVSHLRLERDIYYRNGTARAHMSRSDPYILNDDPDDLNDEFLMLGDNSPRSNDSREWLTTSVVPRRLLIGKAFYIYWPHGVPFLNNGAGYPLANYYEPMARLDEQSNPPIPKFSVPFYPQVGRMRRIR